MYNRIGVIGNKDSVLAFNAVGVEVFDCTQPEHAKELIKRLSKEGFAVIFIAEQLAEQISDVVTRAKTQPYPAIVAIPLDKEGTGYGMRSIKKDVEKALGIDILFNRED
ncbi:MAG: V-type ATP synthase subunit F [Clostridia bacterium]|nr:V-type ATP synthase subunit F [Clostridia bacterium]